MSFIVRAAESVHWYQKDGSPKYTVKARDGSDRPTTLRDARSLDLVPSVTTVLKIASKPGLEAWKMEQMLLAALTLPKRDEEGEKDYIARIVADSKESARSAADEGTRIHESIETWLSGKRQVDHPDIAIAVDKAIFDHFGSHPNHNWIVERAFACDLEFGGKVDIHCKPSTLTPRGVVMDTKTKDFGPDDKVDAYDEHLMQLAAYRYGLEIPRARCANVFVSRTHHGLVKIIEWSEEDLERGWDMFKCLLRYWKLKHGFGDADAY
jgi:hypothetical protein